MFFDTSRPQPRRVAQRLMYYGLDGESISAGPGYWPGVWGAAGHLLAALHVRCRARKLRRTSPGQCRQLGCSHVMRIIARISPWSHNSSTGLGPVSRRAVTNGAGMESADVVIGGGSRGASIAPPRARRTIRARSAPAVSSGTVSWQRPVPAHSQTHGIDLIRRQRRGGGGSRTAGVKKGGEVFGS